MEQLLTILNARDIQPKTIESHITTYKKIAPFLVKPFEIMTYDDILEILDNPSISQLSKSYKRKILSLFIVIYEYLRNDAILYMNDRDTYTYTTHLEKLRSLVKSLSTDMVADRIEKFATTNTDQYEDILRYIFSKEVAEYPKRFIVNYIVFFLNTRNLDLYAQLINSKDISRMDTSINYLVIYPDYTEFIRNTYKTSQKYRQKINIIDDVVFNTLIKHLPVNGWLLTDNKNSLGSLVQSHLYNGMSETDYLKNNIAYFKNDVNKIFQIEQNRGTSIKTLLSSYNKEYDNAKYS
jgi:hypothetical protein